MSKTKAIDLDLGELALVVKQMAKKCGQSPEEFIQEAIQSAIRQREPHTRSMTPHGGKHLSGKQTGYEVTEDGRYYPAPTWTDQFDLLFAERTAIYDLANHLAAHAQERLVQVEKQISSAKRRLIEDLGLDPSLDWVYYGVEKCLRVRVSDAEATTARPAPAGEHEAGNEAR